MPRWKALDQSSNWIIKVPPRHDDEQACRVAEASKKIVGEPVPSLVANGLAVRLSSALDWIVHYADVQALTGDLAPDGGVVK
jgi:hypothetical protein